MDSTKFIWTVYWSIHCMYLDTFTSLSQEEGRESTTAGHFPPNSRTTGVRCFTAADITFCPTCALPSDRFVIQEYENKEVISAKFNVGYIDYIYS